MIGSQGTRVAVLGGTGFVGHSVRTLLELVGMQVGVFSKASGCDLLDLHTAWARLDAFHPDYIVNCAAMVGSVNYVTDFAAEVVDVNMRIILNVYKIAQNLRTAVVINPVANCAYPGVMDLYDEAALWDGPMHPSVLSYGSTRRMMLVLSKCYADQYGVRSINLMVPNMYGPYDSTNPNKTHALNALIIKFIRAVNNGDSAVEVWGTGRPVREWLYVRDFAAVVRRVVEDRTVTMEPVNVAQKSGLTVTDLVDLVTELTGYSGTVVYNARYQDGSPRKVMDNRLFRQRFPDFDFTAISTGVRETIEYYAALL